ncbi:SpaH/EbpB family LPXTG-anchored major pilin [uncultured Gemmiger sp.]|uniref:SpaH/EbpB family LPXTG-anchored major pilin n=1 Tax=uncultured Gemmiger sp. TaxID=1623490 RepID=UPI002665FA35|nr:SpaH/EbpB family LPXTG-anchored major pilin [uncultured Gemmiger sp.]
MKKKLHRWAALCLTLALTFCLALPVWADEPTTYDISVGQTGTIQVNGIQEPAGTTVTVNVYQLMTVKFDTTNQQPEEPLYTWVTEVAQWLKTNTNETYKTYINESDNSVTENFSVPTTDENGTKAAEIAAFYDALAAAIRSNAIVLNATSSQTVQGAGTQAVSASINNLGMGNYLVLIEGGMKVYRPSAVNLVPEWKKTSESPETWEWVLETANVELKSSEPALTKTVSDTQVAIGDTVTYTLVADVPQFPDNALNKGYCISDVLPTGMTYNGNVTVEGYTETMDVGTAGDSLTPATHYTSDTERPTTDTATFVLKFKYDMLKNASGERYTKIKVTYTATVNAAITVKTASSTELTNNINNAYLDYNSDPYGSPSTWQTKTATATVYSYGIEVKKVDKSTQLPISGAEFTLTKANEDDAIKFVGSNGTYRVATATESTTAVETLVVTESGENMGKLILSGLDAGTYTLTETKAPAGYVKLGAPKTITITDDKTAMEGDTANSKPNGLVDDGENSADGIDGYYELDVANSKGFTLPSTGGMGTVLFTTIGIVLMGGGLVLLLLYLRRRNRTE